jgi:hypothetical protein
MRKVAGFKVAGLLFATALVLPIGLIASPAGAAAGTTCKTSTGKATFNPPLPKLGSTTLVKTVLTGTGTLSGCVGGGVTGGSVKTVSVKSSGSNCSTQLANKTISKATETITWNTKQTSTIAITLSPVKGKPSTNKAVSGTVTAGLFKGLHQTGLTVFTPATGSCTATTLSSVTYKNGIPAAFK